MQMQHLQSQVKRLGQIRTLPSFHKQSQESVLFPTDLPHINVDNGISKYSACHNGEGEVGK